MKILNIIWAALFMQSIVASAFDDHDSQAPAQLTDIASNKPQEVLQTDDGYAQDVDDYNTAPQEPRVLLSVGDTLSTIPTSLDVHDASLFGGMSLGKSLELAKVKAEELNLTQVASDIESWLKHHPWMAAFYAASAIGFFAPEILSLPALEALGFGLAGVRAGISKSFTFESSRTDQNGRSGSLAAKVQSVIGDVAARSVFAIWQSARVGGYGVEYVNGGVRALVALTDAAVAACNPLKDCKGLINDGGQRLLGDSMAMTTLAVVCGCLMGLNNLLG